MAVRDIPRDLRYKATRLFIEGVDAFEGEDYPELKWHALNRGFAVDALRLIGRHE